MDSKNEIANVQEMTFENVAIPCPVQEGHKMIPVRAVCQILDVDPDNQDVILREHPFFSQLYKPAQALTSDGKQREMKCLSMFDLYAWVSSISIRNRSEQSMQRQYLFLAWIREKMLGAYKSTEAYIQEADYERKLVELKDKTEEEIQEHQRIIADLKKKTKEIEKSIEEIRYNRMTGQISMSFPEQK